MTCNQQYMFSQDGRQPDTQTLAPRDEVLDSLRITCETYRLIDDGQ